MRALRIVGIVVGCIVVVLVAAAIVLWLIVNPNDYKGRIEAAVRTSTGRDLTLTGNIHLAIFPSLALELGPATLGNPPGFTSSQPFASLQRMSLRVRVLPLLHHRLEVGRVEIDGLDLRLLENARGQGNWAMPAGTTAPPTQQSPAQASQLALGGIAGVVIKNSHFSYQDMVADDVSVTIGHVATGVAVPIKWSVQVTGSAGARPIALSGNATLKYDAKSAQLTGLDARIDDSTVRGSAAVTNLTTGALGFDLTIDQIDLDRYLITAPKSPKTAAPTAQNQQPTELPTGALKTLQLNGKVAIGSATIYGMKVSQLEVGLAANGGVLHVKPAEAQLYGGTSTGDITVDAHGTVPVLDLNENLAGVQVQPLLTAFAKLNRVSGRGNVSVNVTARGNTTAALTSSLDGHVAMNLANGAIAGVNLWSDINSAVALAQRQSPPANTGGNSTPFDSFKASADLTNGVATTKDLDIASGDIHVTGQGSTNLVTEAVNYRVNAALLKGAASSALANIPVLITGTMTSPTVRPDTQALVESAIKSKLRDVLKGLFH